MANSSRIAALLLSITCAGYQKIAKFKQSQQIYGQNRMKTDPFKICV